MKNIERGISLATVFAAMSLLPGVALAQQPLPWGVNFQEPASPIAVQAFAFHDLLLWMIFGVSALVFALLAYIVIRFRESANPAPSQTTHNTVLEVLWTAIPVLILVLIAVPSFRLLYASEDFSDVDLTVKAIGNQWYWEYEYPDHGGFVFSSMLLRGDRLPEGGLRLLEVDNRLIVPAGKKIRLLITSNDVLHAFAVPAFGVKLDAIAGRINETWFQVDQPGVYYGQCSELCGRDHGYMPIAVEVMSQQDFDLWVAQAQQRFAANQRGEAQKYVRAKIDHSGVRQ